MIELDVGGDTRPVRLAGTLDPRDHSGVASVVDLTAVTADDWRTQLEAAAPDAVVVQSIEVRPDGMPVPPLAGRSGAVTRWCRANDVPTVFWSTVSMDRALDDVHTAAAFDHVATADLDALIPWRTALDHDRVHLTPLGVTAPDDIELSSSSAPLAVLAATFDPSRPPDGMVDLLDLAVAELPVAIHDLPPGNGDGVPHDLRALLEPPPVDLPTLDRASRVGLHVPPVAQSPTLLDRRLLELLAAGVPVIGTYSHATKVLIGDIVTSTGDRGRLAAALREALQAPNDAARTRGHQLVRAAHTWEHALRALLAPVLPLTDPMGAWTAGGTTGTPPPDPPVPPEVLSAARRATAGARPAPPRADLRSVADWIAAVDDDAVEVVDDCGDLVVTSDLCAPTDVWAVGTVRPEPLITPGWTTVWLEVREAGMVDLRLCFLDEDGEELTTATAHGNIDTAVSVPRGTRAVRVGLRVHGPGRTRVGGVRLGGEPSYRPVVASGEQLLVTNRYPEYAAPYNNMFVHKRIQGYVDRGVTTDVLRFVDRAPNAVHEFEGVECRTGGARVLDAVVEAAQHRSIAAHFLTPPVWEAMQRHADGRRLCIWIHGFEVQPWWRRAFSYESDEELEHAKEATTARMHMWREVFADPRPHFVFVSQYLADQAMEDTGVELPPDRYSVIHNPIDTDLFAYRPKDAEQRFRLLSIRPFASNIYANDLTVAAILELVDEPWFERLEITIIGEGRLFADVTAPLRDLDNVRVEPRFLQQAEIAALHRDHGIFLCPSRLDSHGVSRDEAMSSGLVPVTSDVAAIPEFVDADCGFLAPPDDHVAVADAIRTLVEDPDRFERMSAAAAARVRRQADHRLVLDQELAVLRG